MNVGNVIAYLDNTGTWVYGKIVEFDDEQITIKTGNGNCQTMLKKYCTWRKIKHKPENYPTMIIRERERCFYDINMVQGILLDDEK